MEIRHFRLIRVLADCQTLTKAGELLFLTQPALSHQLKEVESFFGATLFNRVGKKMIITQAGARALLAAEKILLEFENSKSDIQNIISGKSGKLKISTACYTSYHWLSLFLDEYSGKYPGIEIDVITEATHKPIEFLMQGKLDILIINQEINDPAIEAHKIFDDEMLAVVHPGHPLARKKIVMPEDLVHYPYLMYTSTDNNSRTYNEVFTANNLHPKQVKRIQLTEAIIELTKAGLGVSILAKWAIKPSLDNKELVGLRITRSGYRRTWYVAMMKDKMKAKYVVDFREGIKQFFPSTLDVIKSKKAVKGRRVSAF
jgi:LysR family transcriptional regulator for metE and metH